MLSIAPNKDILVKEHKAKCHVGQSIFSVTAFSFLSSVFMSMLWQLLLSCFNNSMVPFLKKYQTSTYNI